MNTDIRVSVSFRGHRKRKKLQRLLGAEAVLCVIDLWIVAAMTRPDGVLVGMDADDIAMDAGWDGDANEFVAALVEVGFLDDLDGVYALHDWDDHNSYASAVDDRSDKARFSRMRQAYPELYWRLHSSGLRAISKDEYQRSVEEYLAGGCGASGEHKNTAKHVENKETGDAVTTPGQRRDHAVANEKHGGGEPINKYGEAPAPSPSPSPSPSLKNVKTLCGASGQGEVCHSAPAGAVFARNGVAWFEKFWEAFADKRGKDPAWKSWRRIKAMDQQLAERIIDAASKYAEQRPAVVAGGGTPKMAQGWLADRRWEDEDLNPVVAGDGAMVPSLRNAFDRVLGGIHGQPTAA